MDRLPTKILKINSEQVKKRFSIGFPQNRDSPRPPLKKNWLVEDLTVLLLSGAWNAVCLIFAQTLFGSVPACVTNCSLLDQRCNRVYPVLACTVHKSSLSGSGPFESPALWGSGDWPNLQIKWQDSLVEMVACRNRDMPDWRITLSFHAHRRTCEDFFPVIFVASMTRFNNTLIQCWCAHEMECGHSQSTPISV